MPDAPEPYQSLYRRYRPQRFAEVLGQDTVTTALRNAVRSDRVSHAYLFSGPRGTGKTSTARILAKVLNCTDVQDGEPCGVCDSCVAVQAGASFDVVELDAASNNKVEDMRSLLERVALGSPGRRKVYIVDEVHMLTAGASNALLKTLEEPPAHVVFVLATTDPQKVLPTIRSRTQPFEFRLLAPAVLADLLADVNAKAALGLDEDTLDRVVTRGHGSARDALSALDQAAALGSSEPEHDVVPAIVDAMADRAVGPALVAVAEAIDRGRDALGLAGGIVAHLRSAFLLTMAPAVAGVPEHERPALEVQAARLGPAAIVRGIELLGQALVDMREALDTRVTLEMALVRLCSPNADTSPAALVERIESLERRIATGNMTAAPPTPSPSPAAAPQGGPKQTIGAVRQRPVAVAPSAPAPPPSSVPDEPSAPTSVALVDRDELTKVWGDQLFQSMSHGVRAIYRTGRWISVDEGVAVFVVPNQQYLDRAEDKRIEVEQALAAHFGARLHIKLEIDGAPLPAPSAEPDPGPSPGAGAGPSRGSGSAPGGASGRRTAGGSGPGGSGPGGSGRSAGPGPASAREPGPFDDPPDEDISAAEFADLEPAPPGPGSAESTLLQAFPGTTEVPE